MANKRGIIDGCFGSAKLAIFLFFALALTSIAGTVIPQGLSPEQYHSLYSPRLYALLDFLDLFDMFHSWWFTFLIGLLAVNLIVCTVKQFRRIYRMYLVSGNELDDNVFQTSPFKKSFRSDKSLSEIEEQSKRLLKTFAGRPLSAMKGGTSYLFAEKGKYSRLGVVFVHASVLLILGGGLIAAIWGFDGRMTVVEGETSDRVYLSGGKRILGLGFDVRCDDFTVNFYETGIPKEYRSDLTIMERGKEVLSAPVRVNHPLRYGGLTFYQAAYGVAQKSYFTVAVRNNRTGKEMLMKMGMMEKVPLPGTDAQLAIGDFNPDYEGRGPALLGVFLEKGKPHRMFRIFTEGAAGSRAEDDFNFVLKDFKRYYYTGLRVARNPGMPLVWYGFLLVLVGFVLNLFFTHDRVWLRIAPLEKGCEVSIAAGSSRRIEALGEKLDKFSKKLGVE